MSEKGYDVFLVIADDNGRHLQGLDCKVCGSECDVQRDVTGPMSWGGAMAGIHKKHDVFTCPHSYDAWHIQALRLIKAVEETPSPTLAEIMRKDLEAVVEKGLREKKK